VRKVVVVFRQKTGTQLGETGLGGESLETETRYTESTGKKGRSCGGKEEGHDASGILKKSWGRPKKSLEGGVVTRGEVRKKKYGGSTGTGWGAIAVLRWGLRGERGAQPGVEKRPGKKEREVRNRLGEREWGYLGLTGRERKRKHKGEGNTDVQLEKNVTGLPIV